LSCANDDADIWFYLLSFAGTFIEDVKAMYKKDKEASGVFVNCVHNGHLTANPPLP